MTCTPETFNLTQEQINNIVAGAVNKTLEGLNKEKPFEKTINEEAKNKVKEEEAANNDREDLESSIKFNMGISKFVEDNEALLPKEAKKIIETINAKTYKSEKKKADEVRKSLIDSFIEVQENIDILPASQKEALSRYKSLTEDEKLKQSSSFWGIVDVGINHKMLTKKASQLSKTGEETGNVGAFEQRFIDLGKKYLKEK